MITPEQFVAEARTWLGVPFRHQGRTRHGVDCIGLVLCVRRAFGPFDPPAARNVRYRRNPQAQLLQGIEGTCIRLQQPEPGCLAMIQWPHQEHAAHVAILTPGTIIHAYAKCGQVIETTYGNPWVRWTTSLWRIPGVEP